MEKRYCNRCNTEYSVVAFTRARRGHNPLDLNVFKICNECHHRSNGGRDLCVEVDADEEDSYLMTVECNMNDLVDVMRECFDEDDLEDNTIFFRLRVLLKDDSLTGEFHTWNSNSAIVALSSWLKTHVIPDVEVASGYHWEVRNSRVSEKHTSLFTSTLWCASRSDRVKFRERSELENSSHRQQEKKRRIERFDCNGTLRITLDIEQKIMMLTCQHLFSHAKPTNKRHSFPKEAITFLESIANLNQPKSEVYRMLCEQHIISSMSIPRAQVNYWISDVFSRRYLRDVDDQVKSVSLLIRSPNLQSKGFKEVLHVHTAEYIAFAFCTPFWERVSSVREIAVDSTFKTNSMRFQLFVVAANTGGFSLPLSYLFYLEVSDPKKGIRPESEHARKGVLITWFDRLRGKGLRPVFALTDKVVGQISALRTAFPAVYVQLCLKQAQSAIEMRCMYVGSGKSVYDVEEAARLFPFIDPAWVPDTTHPPGQLASVGKRKEVIEMITRHFNLHSLFPSSSGEYFSSDVLHTNAVKEAYEWCNAANLVHLWIYLWREWYCPDKWKLFSRASKPLLSLSRTTDIVESHWRKLKNDYKYAVNRPRLDKLTLIIADSLVSDLQTMLQQILNGRVRPSWWEQFRIKWRKLAALDRSTSGRIFVDVDKWVCSCLSFSNSPYLLCQHLVHAYGQRSTAIPRFESTYRRTTYPLYIFDTEVSFFDREVVPEVANPWFQSGRAVTSETETANLDVSDDVNSTGRVVPPSRSDDVADSQAWLREYLLTSDHVRELVAREAGNQMIMRELDSAWKPFQKKVNQCIQASRARGPKATRESNSV